MIALQSEMQLDSFAVLQSHYEFLPSGRNPKDLLKLFRSYQIDIDFAHKINENNTVQVFTKISVNKNGKSLPGYKLFVEGVAIFSTSKTEELSESEKKNLIYFSTVNILIGYLRNTLNQMTSSSPMGPYLLPPINVADLFRKKAESKQSQK
jgi:preprotein translocase subunit SecB